LVLTHSLFCLSYSLFSSVDFLLCGLDHGCRLLDCLLSFGHAGGNSISLFLKCLGLACQALVRPGKALVILYFRVSCHLLSLEILDIFLGEDLSIGFDRV